MKYYVDNNGTVHTFEDYEIDKAGVVKVNNVAVFSNELGNTQQEAVLIRIKALSDFSREKRKIAEDCKRAADETDDILFAVVVKHKDLLVDHYKITEV